MALKKSPARTQSALGGGVAGIEEESDAANQGPVPNGKTDQFTDRLLKYIPAEVVVVYAFVDGLIRNAPSDVPREKLLWGVFFFLLAGTWVYLARVQKVSKKMQLAISTLAFAVWVFSLGGPFVSFSWYKPFYGSVLLPLYTFGVSAIQAQSPASAGRP
ncbi:MAG TPA: hypothetical protein VI685_09165 [Candidatus Angelobacter sp.]